MAVTLRFQRHGTKHKPFYHLVAADSRKARDCRFIEKIGYYDPASEPSLINFKQERMQFWYARGATLSHSVAMLVKKNSIKLERPTTKSTAKKVAPVAAAPAAAKKPKSK